MTSRGHEDELAELFEAVVLHALGQTPGVRQRHDAGAGRLRVDFTYDDATPPLALEVTSVENDDMRKAAAAAHKAKQQLTEIVEGENLGAWTIAFSATSPLKRILPEAIEMMRQWARLRPEPGSFYRPGSYTSEDLLRCGSDRNCRLFKKEHQRLRRLGLIELCFIGRLQNRVEFLTQGDAFVVGHSVEPLLVVVEENRVKLGETRPRETHLLVEIRRPDLSVDLADASPPELPHEIDFLWVLFSWNRDSNGSPFLWSTKGSENEWVRHSSSPHSKLRQKATVRTIGGYAG